MNKAAIKNFAVWARNKLIADITYRAGLMGIAEDGIKAALPQSTKDTEFYDIGTKEPYSIAGEAVRQRRRLAELIDQKTKSSDYKTAYRSVLEEVAYTWFNRLIAIRFMEVNDYLPSRIRVLSSESKGKLEPDLVTTPFDADMELTEAEKETVMRLKTDNQVDDLFRLLFVKQCNALNQLLPKLFEKTADYTELLLNVSVTDQNGVVYHLVHDIDEDDFNIEKGGQVEIIGWLYQYYNTEPKDEAFALLKKNVKITKERIPAATQLFTPDWIVRYMVENSLGRLWLEGHPSDELKAGWKYYLDETEQEADVEAQLAQIREEYKTIKPDDIKVIDPCMGSGHILVYAFDVLMQIYEAAGYTQRDAAKSILENNLYGLDIDDRAFQLAYFAIMMKARQYNRRILNGETDCHVYSVQESNAVNHNHLKYLGAGMDELERNNALNQLNGLLDTFIDAKEYGSILNVDTCDWDLLRRFVAESSEDGQMSMDSFGLEDTKEQLRTLVDVGQILERKYDIVITNPPYMANGGFSPKMDCYIKKYYPAAKFDLYAVFIFKCKDMTVADGKQAMITQHSWMFISSYAQLRKELRKIDVICMAHLGARAFEEIAGEVVQTVTFVLTNRSVPNYLASYDRLVDAKGQQEKENLFLKHKNVFFTPMKTFDLFPGNPYVYWVKESIIKCFTENKPLDSLYLFREGIHTADNERFLKVWFEVPFNKIVFNAQSFEDIDYFGRWVPYNKGGKYRKWFGNNEYLIRFDAASRAEMQALKGHVRPSQELYFREGGTWTAVASGKLGLRYYPNGYLFDAGGQVVVGNNVKVCIGLLNTKIYNYFADMLMPTLNYKCGMLKNLPYLEVEDISRFHTIVDDCIQISMEDWNMRETSWSFVHHPMIPAQHVNERCEYVYSIWEDIMNSRFEKMKGYERELNQAIITQYHLEDTFNSDVADSDITISLPDLNRDIRSLISYAVGCMFGRYSLDEPGLILAGQPFSEKYVYASVPTTGTGVTGDPSSFTYTAGDCYLRVGDGVKQCSFAPDKDNILPITDEEYFPDDIVGLFCAWLKKVYGEDTLEANLDFIAKALGNKGNTSREIIRNYFLNDFFKDHCQTYFVTGSGKRPIYWLFDSGKQNGFKALVYMHRYDENTIGNLRIDYLHRMERVYDNEIARMQDIIDNSKVAREVTQATKRREKLQKQLKECKEYDERIAHLALARIPIDLDDGVKVNYEKVQTVDGVKYPVLAKI